jgi:hypothetical protein
MGVRGSPPVHDHGPFTRFAAAKVYGVIAYRGSACSNVLAVHVQR